LVSQVKATKAHIINVAITDEKQLSDFEGGLVRDLVDLRALYVRNAHTIGGLCSPMPKGEPSTADYLCWLSIEISSLPDMFGGINENFATVAIEGAVVMAGDSVDLDALQSTAAESGADLLPTERDMWRATRALLKKWWRSFSYDNVLTAFCAMHEKVLVCM
jgi:hypothetical protein